MTSRRIGAAMAATAALTLGLAACSSSSSSSSSSGSGGSDTIKIGIKFDQPGLGLKQGNDYTGFDVDVAKYVANKLGYSADKIQWVQAVSAQRETMIDGGQVQLVFATYSITDARKQKVSFAGPYLIAGQDLLVRNDDTSITGVNSLNGKKLCSVTGSTSAQNVKAKVPGVNLTEMGTYSECVAGLVSGAIDALTTDNTILAGYASQAQYKGKLKLVGQPFTTERYGVGLKKGDTALCTKVNAALASMISDGSWQKAIDADLGPAGFKPGTGNPPKQDACS